MSDNGAAQYRRSGVLAVVAARDEADRIAVTLAALRRAFPGVALLVADDGSSDETAAIARREGARVVGSARRAGKGQAMTLAVRTALGKEGEDSRTARGGALTLPRSSKRGVARARARARNTGDFEDSSAGHPPAGRVPTEPIVLLCDGDLGACAHQLGPLVEAVRRNEADLAVAAFSTRVGGGLGIALTFARWAVRRCCGLSLRAPLSGQRAARADLLTDLLPFAPGFGMEIGMTIDAARAGHRVIEVELPLSHRPTGRDLAGFVHRGRQLVDIVWAYASRLARPTFK